MSDGAIRGTVVVGDWYMVSVDARDRDWSKGTLAARADVHGNWWAYSLDSRKQKSGKATARDGEKLQVAAMREADDALRGFEDRADAFEKAAEMGREAGPTVPRAAVEALRDRWSSIASTLSSDVEGNRELRMIEGASKALAEVVAALDDLLADNNAPAWEEPSHADD